MGLDKRDFPGVTFPEWLHKYVAEAPYPAYGPGHRITVKAGLHYLRGNRFPYFSVTAEIGRPGARDCESCGCLHDEVLAQWPELAPVVALHLSDSDGAPMYAVDNGWYEIAGYYGGAGQAYHAGNSKHNYPLPDAQRDPAKPWQTTEYRHPTADECLMSWAKHVRIPFDEARTLADGWLASIPGFADASMIKGIHAAWIETQRLRWAAEAEAACQLLDRLSAGV